MARSMIEAMVPEMETECINKGTKDEITCALKAQSLDDLEQCDGSKQDTVAPAQARWGGPSESSCRDFADKIVALTVKGQEGEAADMARSMIEAMRPEMIKECLEQGTRSEISCALRANSLDDLERCDSSK